MFALEFEGADTNNHRVYQVTTVGSGWHNFDAAVTDLPITVFESVQQMTLPLVCCLCSSDFTAAYQISNDSASGQYTFSLSDEKWGVSIDEDTQRAFEWSGYSDTLRIYDLNDGSVVVFSPDFSASQRVIPHNPCGNVLFCSLASVLYLVLDSC